MYPPVSLPWWRRPDGLARGRAREVFVAEAVAVQNVAGATLVLDRLLSSGWRYAVGGTTYRTGSSAD